MKQRAVGKQAFNEKLAGLEAIRKDPSAAEALPTLRGALRGPGYLAGKAASLVAQAGRKELIPDLLAAFTRLFANPLKADPQCWGKSAIAKALKDLGFAESATYLGGAAHVQMEPVWGGQEDTAGTLRGTCLLALVECHDLPDVDLLTHLTDALADRKKLVRVDAVRAIGQVGREEGALLLRLKALAGDPEVEVTAACLATLIAMRAPGAIAFAARFLKAEDPDVRLEAAAVLGESRDPSAFAVLRDAREKERDRELRGALLAAMGTLRQEDSIGFLLSLIGRGAPEAAEDALVALAPSRFSEEIRERVRTAVKRGGSDRLMQVFEQHFHLDT
jgi:HEAT repeat protein